jgi:hypothetical protein
LSKQHTAFPPELIGDHVGSVALAEVDDPVLDSATTTGYQDLDYGKSMWTMDNVQVNVLMLSATCYQNFGYIPP